MSITAKRHARSIVPFNPIQVQGVLSEVGFNINATYEDSVNALAPWDEFTADIDRAVAMGATWIRTGADMWMTGGWWQTEDNQLGNWYPTIANWDGVRERLKYAHSRGLKIVFTTPALFRDWDDVTHVPLNTFENMLAHNTIVYEQIAAYWGPWISVWGILNEFDKTNYRTLEHYDGSSSSTIPASYWQELATVISACSDAIKSSAPHILTTYSGWGFPASTSRWQYWRDLYDSIGSKLDIFGVNAYTDYFEPSYPTSNTTITTQSASIATTQAYTSKPIFLTETGFPGFFAAATDPIANGEKKANDTIPLNLRTFKQAGVRVSILYKLRDDGLIASSNGEDHFGVFYKDGSPKSYCDNVANECAPLVHRTSIPSGDSVMLSAQADVRYETFSWRIVSGGGAIISASTPVTRYIAPIVGAETTIVIAVRGGVTTPDSAEKLLRFTVAP